MTFGGKGETKLKGEPPYLVNEFLAWRVTLNLLTVCMANFLVDRTNYWATGAHKDAGTGAETVEVLPPPPPNFHR